MSFCVACTHFLTVEIFQPEHVLQALKRYMAAEQKDRRHTLRHYQHIVAVDPQKAEQMKFQVRASVSELSAEIENRLGGEVCNV